MQETPLIFWVIFNGVVLLLLGLDLLWFHRKPRAVSGREAAAWSAFWITLSLGFNAYLWWWRGSDFALAFFTGYVVEYSLSVDNIFVFVLIFTWFKVPAEYQHRVLFWGIIGALVMRGLMIWLGVTLIDAFHWILYVFGAFLILTGLKMLKPQEEEIDPEHNPFVRLCTRFFPMTRNYAGANFTVRQGGVLLLTPLALVLVMVESTDLLFAVDSIPAIIGILRSSEVPQQHHAFLIYTSNVCAILGLRSLYFLLARAMHKFAYLRFALAAILTFIGVKMVMVDWVKIPTPMSLAFIGFCLGTAGAVSWLLPPEKSGVAP